MSHVNGSFPPAPPWPDASSLPSPTFPRGLAAQFGQPAYERGRRPLIAWCLRRADLLPGAAQSWLCEAEANPAEFSHREAVKLGGLFQRIVRGGAPPVLAPGDLHGKPVTRAAAHVFYHHEAARLLAELAAILSASPESLWRDVKCRSGFMLALNLRAVYLRVYPAGPLPPGATDVVFVPPLMPPLPPAPAGWLPSFPSPPPAPPPDLSAPWRQWRAGGAS